MRSSSVFSTALFVSASLLAVQADVFPNYPSGQVLNSGSECKIGWGGDTNATSKATGDWKDMTIEFMTGDNFQMVHLTTVATGQDGTADGSYTWTCPEVVPNSAIYFYQFRSPHTDVYQWTTRFTVASDSGATTPPEHATQTDGQAVPWGTGALADPSIAVAAPVFGSTSGSASGSSSASSVGGGAGGVSTAGATGTGTFVGTSAGASSTKPASSSASGSKTATSSSASATSSNAARSKSGLVDFRFMQAAVVLAASAMGFTLLL
ncbi:hypothetical protein C8J56DRAFT_832305 [Mycena floridula]|nr:hypothetical protein C8J56DRAFT_832305 [Mycena floridula]